MDVDPDPDASMDIEPPAYPTLPPTDEDDEWTYVMRRSMQEIIPGLFLGPYASATRSSLGNMLGAGLTHVVCVRSDIEAHLIRANHMDHFQYLIVQIDDPPTDSLIPKVKTVSAFIENCLNNGGKVLVHGNAGMSRSAALVIGYIMSKFGVNFKTARKYVQSKRFCISVSETFAVQLREYEPIYMAEVHKGRNSAQFNAIKRKIDEMASDDEEGGAGSSTSGGHRRRLDDDEPTLDDDESMEM